MRARAHLVSFRPALVAALVHLALSAFAGRNLLVNAGFEWDLSGWTTDHGAIRTTSPSPHGGAKYLMGGNDGSAASYTYQVLDLVALEVDTAAIDLGALQVSYGGWQAGWSTQTDQGKIEIIISDGEDVLDTSDLGWFYSNYTWYLKEERVPLPVGARFITYGFYARRYQGSNNDGYLDDAFLVLTTGATPPRIADIERNEGTLTLTFIDLTPFVSNTVQTSTNLLPGSWSDIDAFIIENTSTNWVGPLDPAWPRMYYRLKSE
jgi:hypothetical protein